LGGIIVRELFGASQLHFFIFFNQCKDIIKSSNIYATIYFNINHIFKSEWIVKKWIHDGHLKWWHYVYHKNKMKNVESKSMS
jgi:hypothetical protein